MLKIKNNNLKTNNKNVEQLVLSNIADRNKNYTILNSWAVSNEFKHIPIFYQFFYIVAQEK